MVYSSQSTKLIAQYEARAKKTIPARNQYRLLIEPLLTKLSLTIRLPHDGPSSTSIQANRISSLHGSRLSDSPLGRGEPNELSIGNPVCCPGGASADRINE